MKNTQLKTIALQTTKITAEVGDYIRAQIGKVASAQIETKSINSLVSHVDKTAEEMLVKQLGELIPGSVFITEEETIEQAKGEFQWIIDPLDGTTNFLHGLPVFSISVALRQNEETILGVVLEINRNECFYAWKGGGAFLNEEKIQVSNCQKLEDSLIATGFPYYDFEREEAYFKVFRYFIKNTRGIRRLGSAAVDLAYVACGRFEGYFEYSSNAWDVAAGAFIVQEAGGQVCDFSGGTNYLFGREIIATSGAFHEDFVEIISPLKL